MKLGYVSVNLDKEQERVLSREIAEAGLHPVSEYDMHVTVLYDDRDCDELRCVVNPDVVFSATVLGFKPLGKAIVMELHSIGLHTEHKRLVEAGYEHSFDSLMLHMSVVYKPDEYALEAVKVALDSWLGKTLYFSNESVRDCE